jgi:hypothetical protein
MKSLYALTLFTLLFTSCKQQVSGNQNNTVIPIQSGSCNIGKWSASSLPLNLKIAPEIANDFSGANIVGSSTNPIEQMAKVWNDAVTPTTTLFKLPLSVAAGNGSATLSGFRDNELGIYKSHTWFTNVSSSALAITQFYGIVRSDGTLGTYIDLTHADIILNYYNFGADFSYTGNSFVDYDVPTILLHEMGHFLGLCHENNYNSIMAPYYYSTQRTLKTFDTNKIQALYLNNQNYGVNAISAPTNALSAPVGSEVKGVVELNANGVCKHYINGKLVYQHIQQ